MKHCCVALALFVLAAPTLGEAKRKRTMRSVKHVVLDPGHGGDNHGTPGAHGVDEKYITLPIALEVERLLRQKTDAVVTLTRRDDAFVGLRERTRQANAEGGDVFLSIHCNASPNTSARGVEVYFLSPDAATEEIARLVEDEERGGDKATPGAPAAQRAPDPLEALLEEAVMFRAHEQAQVLAEIMLEALHDELRAPRRGVFQAPFGVLKEARMPAVVVEVGFSSHEVEGQHLTTVAYQKRVAKAIFEGLIAMDKRSQAR